MHELLYTKLEAVDEINYRLAEYEEYLKNKMAFEYIISPLRNIADLKIQKNRVNGAKSSHKAIKAALHIILLEDLNSFIDLIKEDISNKRGETYFEDNKISRQRIVEELMARVIIADFNAKYLNLELNEINKSDPLIKEIKKFYKAKRKAHSWSFSDVKKEIEYLEQYVLKYGGNL